MNSRETRLILTGAVIPLSLGMGFAIAPGYS
jgi:hypothetical protein